MSEETRTRLIKETLRLMAVVGPDEISMRRVAQESNIQQSVIYYYFPDKDSLLAAAFGSAQKQIRAALMGLRQLQDPREMLQQRINYHFTHGHLIVPMLRYFMAVKLSKPGVPGAFIPEAAYRHIQEPIELGNKTGVFSSPDPAADARIITHAINGLILEHYPDKLTPKTRRELEQNMYLFIERALTAKGGMPIEQPRVRST